MGIMYVPHLESGTVSGQTAGSQSGKTPFMSQFAQRIVLIHKLRQLGRTEKLFYRCLYRLNVNQYLRGNLIQIVSGHSFTNYPFHSGQPYSVLILQQFAYGTDTPVAQMVDIVIVSDAVFQMDIIINGSDNVFLCNMLRYQFMHVLLDSLCQTFRILAVLFQNLCQNRIIYGFRYAQFSWVAVHETGNIHHHIGKNLNILFLCLDIYIRHCCVLDGIRQFCGHLRPCRCQNLTGRHIHHILCQNVMSDPVPKC